MESNVSINTLQYLLDIRKYALLKPRMDGLLTPEDIVDPFSYDSGVNNTSVDYIKTNHDNDTFLRYETAFNNSLISGFQTTAEIQYEKVVPVFS